MDTKACNLTKYEIEELIMSHGRALHDKTEDRLERMNYLYKRLKAFNEEKPQEEAKQANAAQSAASQGW